jgi:enoyl-CoA hydratase/carnithine racemase
MITCDVKGRVARVTILRAEEGNAMTAEMVRKLRDIFRELSDATIVTLTGDGADFCLGRDRHEAKSGSPFDAFNLVNDLNAAASELQGILVSAVRGRAYGLGVGLVMRSDLALASSDATFALDEVKHGIPPMFIMSAISDHLAPKHALNAVLTSRAFDANTALQMGLVSEVAPAASFETSFNRLVADLESRDPQVLLACKRYFRTIGSVPGHARGAVALAEQAMFSTPPR